MSWQHPGSHFYVVPGIILPTRGNRVRGDRNFYQVLLVVSCENNESDPSHAHARQSKLFPPPAHDTPNQFTHLPHTTHGAPPVRYGNTKTCPTRKNKNTKTTRNTSPSPASPARSFACAPRLQSIIDFGQTAAAARKTQNKSILLA